MGAVPGSNDTIVALSTGSPPTGIAIVRISGPKAFSLTIEIAGSLPPGRQMSRRRFVDPQNGLPLDNGLLAIFAAPASFTGEDCAEFHVHGSSAVIRGMLRALCAAEGVRLAEPGEFTRRAYENGKIDLAQAEGLGDLLAAETESQRLQAFGRMSGELSTIVGAWREALLDLSAEIEAQLDFSDESDVAPGLPDWWLERLAGLETGIAARLADGEQGRLVREGVRIAIGGLPNAGKSSLLNALARSDVAIVTAEAGTTRDVRETPLNIGGYLVILIDMAGLRVTTSAAEAEGVRRAGEELSRADLVLWLFEPGTDGRHDGLEWNTPLWSVATKADLMLPSSHADFAISSITGIGLEELTSAIGEFCRRHVGEGAPALISRERDRACLNDALQALGRAGEVLRHPEIAAEELRLSRQALERLVGIVDAEDILDRLFANFCIGK